MGNKWDNKGPFGNLCAVFWIYCLSPSFYLLLLCYISKISRLTFFKKMARNSSALPHQKHHYKTSNWNQTFLNIKSGSSLAKKGLTWQSCWSGIPKPLLYGSCCFVVVGGFWTFSHINLFSTSLLFCTNLLLLHIPTSYFLHQHHTYHSCRRRKVAPPGKPRSGRRSRAP